MTMHKALHPRDDSPEEEDLSALSMPSIQGQTPLKRDKQPSQLRL